MQFLRSTSIILLIILTTFSARLSAQNNRMLFSAAEMANVKVADVALFQINNILEINLDQLTEQQYSFPLPGAKVISAYGASTTRRGHSGIDIKTAAKDTIRAVFDGVVRMSKPYAGYGNLIVIRHPNGLETLYSHNATNFVEPGEIVKVGQPIALVGRTGRATTDHLHFEVRVNGEVINPNYLFDFKTRTLRRNPLVCVKNGAAVTVRVDKEK